MTDPLLSLLTTPPWLGMIHARLGAVLPSRVHLLLKASAPIDGEPKRKRQPPMPGRGRGRPAVLDTARSCSVCGWLKEASEFRSGRMKCRTCTNESWNVLRARKKVVECQ